MSSWDNAEGFLLVAAGEGFELLLQLGFLAGEIPGGFPEVAHLLVELVGRTLSKLVAHLLELLLGAGAGSEGGGNLAVLELLGGLLHFVPGLLQFLTRLRHP